MENNINKKSVKFQGGMFNFCDFIQVFVFTRNHHLNYTSGKEINPTYSNERVHNFFTFSTVTLLI